MNSSPAANKGEWSELYVLFKIFADRKITAADMNLQPTSEEYRFLQVIREDVEDREYIYDLEQAGVIRILNSKSGALIRSISSDDLPEKTKKIFDAIKQADSSSFAISEAVELMTEFDIEKIKASSGQKSDLVAVIRDKIVERSKPIGFSIKSQIGGASTLLNASKRTNFVYKINGFEGDIEEINAIGGSKKIRDRLSAIIQKGGTLEFSHVDSTVFTRNMRLIDTIMPNVLASMLIDYYLGLENSMEGLVKLCGDKKLYDMGEAEVGYKTKSFLRAVALGMVPSREWDTYLSTYGGYIVVKEDGVLVCYHLYNDDDFKDYLYKNTKLETPSSTRHDFGSVYSDGDQLMINLNLQIRFTQ